MSLHTHSGKQEFFSHSLIGSRTRSLLHSAAPAAPVRAITNYLTPALHWSRGPRTPKARLGQAFNRCMVKVSLKVRCSDPRLLLQVIPGSLPPTADLGLQVILGSPPLTADLGLQVIPGSLPPTAVLRLQVIPGSLPPTAVLGKFHPGIHSSVTDCPLH